MIAVDHQHAVAGAQRQRIGGDVHAFRRVLGEGDLIGRHAEKPRQLRASLLDAVKPHAFRASRLKTLAEEEINRRLDRPRERRLETGVEIGDALDRRKFLPHGIDVVVARHPVLPMNAPGGAHALHKSRSPVGSANDMGNALGRSSIIFIFQ